MTLVQQATAEGDVAWVNASGLEVTPALETAVDRVARQVASWVDETQGRSRSHLFDRSAYATPRDPYQVMRVAKGAVENDDVVGSVADAIEGYMFHQGMKWEAENEDDADVFNQISRDLNLDHQLRIWNREEFTYSQVVIGLWWGQRSYTVRGKTQKGNKKRSKYDIACPVAMTFLDPLKVVPLPPGPFGQDRLAWHASRGEYADYAAMSAGMRPFDPVMSEFFAGMVTGLSQETRSLLASWRIDPSRLIYLNPRNVFRHTRTKAPYEAFPSVRLKSIFPQLDLKQQLMEADRVSLVGAANYILLVKKGVKDDPATQEELDNLNAGMKTLAKLPVIVGDHRLEIEIITPEQQWTLDHEKYDTLDSRILSRTLGTLTAGSSSVGERSTGSISPGTSVGRMLQSRRDMMARTIEAEIARAIVEHPMNVNAFDEAPSLAFTQRNIQVVSDVEFAQQVMALRTQKEISRESTLDYFGFDQATEAQRREMEEERFDDIFQTQVPFSAGGPGGPSGQEGPNGAGEDPSVSGARGGRPQGGGQSAQSPQAQTRRRSNGGSNPSTGGTR